MYNASVVTSPVRLDVRAQNVTVLLKDVDTDSGKIPKIKSFFFLFKT